MFLCSLSYFNPHPPPPVQMQIVKVSTEMELSALQAGLVVTQHVPFGELLASYLSFTVCDRRGPLMADLGSSSPMTSLIETSIHGNVFDAIDGSPVSLLGTRKENGPILPSTHQFWSSPYVSPLLAFRSYRLSPYYRQRFSLKLSSNSFAHKIDPFKEFCPYDVHGECRDAACPYQHERDYKLSDRELIQVRSSKLFSSVPNFIYRFVLAPSIRVLDMLFTNAIMSCYFFLLPLLNCKLVRLQSPCLIFIFFRIGGIRTIAHTSHRWV